ncbi:MAG: CRISPR-associated protein Csx18 [Pseudanabaenaceae cyanobacterium SKYGB_i_bin29]|nr:CRISPR-associated protein Csx18 [Pseudanabaenaceae cyanobacterium SKYG29]MDW8420442.1 CRISPR-associated protein Csx18 [Pseudanabaenaceae cyanobacterium SKYGB_i_bin29]
MTRSNFLYAVTAKQCLLRNITLAICNGAVSLVILLIAPLGLAAVITNTFLIMVATYGVSVMFDRIFTWLQSPPKGLHSSRDSASLYRQEDVREIERDRGV